MYKILFLIIFACWGVEASQYPLIYNLVSTQCPGCEISFTFQQQLVEMGGMVDEIVDSGHRQVTIGTKRVVKNGDGTTHEWFNPINLSAKTAVLPDETYAEAAVRLYTDVPSAQWNMATLSKDSVSGCIAYAFVSRVAGDLSWSEVISPGGCIPVPPSYDWCELDMPTIFIDHGTMGMGATNGNSATQNIGVGCITPTAVAFSLVQQQNYIDLEPSGRAEIEVDNKPLGTEIDLPEGHSTLSVKSTLSGITTEGVNSGSNVLVMMPY